MTVATQAAVFLSRNKMKHCSLLHMKPVFKVILMAAAVEEMPEGYDQLMIPVIENIPVMIAVLVLTVPVAMLSMRLAERSLKK